MLKFRPSGESGLLVLLSWIKSVPARGPQRSAIVVRSRMAVTALLASIHTFRIRHLSEIVDNVLVAPLPTPPPTVPATPPDTIPSTLRFVGEPITSGRAAGAFNQAGLSEVDHYQ